MTEDLLPILVRALDPVDDPDHWDIPVLNENRRAIGFRLLAMRRTVDALSHLTGPEWHGHQAQISLLHHLRMLVENMVSDMKFRA